MLQVTQTSEDIFGFEKYRRTDKTEEEHRGISNTSLVLLPCRKSGLDSTVESDPVCEK